MPAHEDFMTLPPFRCSYFDISRSAAADHVGGTVGT